jgi:hypothetical protein
MPDATLQPVRLVHGFLCGFALKTKGRVIADAPFEFIW